MSKLDAMYAFPALATRSIHDVQSPIDRSIMIACNKKSRRLIVFFFVLPYFFSQTNKQQKTMPLSRKYVPLDSDSDVRRDSSLSDTDNCVKAKRDVQRYEDERGKRSRLKTMWRKVGCSGDEYREGRREEGESEERSGVKATASSKVAQGTTTTKRQEDEKPRKKQSWWDVIIFAGPI